MNREAFLESLMQVFEECHAISSKKNQDYANTDDPFQNFKTAALAHISLEKGIFVRMLDKITRIGNLLDRDAAVADEKLEDTLKDLINYAAFIVMYQREQARMEKFKLGALMPQHEN